MDALISYLVNVISLGGTYALLALGLAVIFSVLGLINFAHGELMTLTGYVLLAGILTGQPFWLAVLVAVIAGGVAAVTRILGFIAVSASESEVWLNFLQYLIPLMGLGWALRAVFRQRPSRFISLTSRRSGATRTMAAV